MGQISETRYFAHPTKLEATNEVALARKSNWKYRLKRNRE